MARIKLSGLMRTITLLAMSLSINLACPARPVEVPAPEQIVTKCRNSPQFLDKDVDILFMIDNSPSMEQEQVLLSQEFPKLIDALKMDKLGGKIPNVHIGVISPNLGAGPYTAIKTCTELGGDKGDLQNTPRITGCNAPSDKWISYIEGTTNIASGNADQIERVKESFSCIAALGKDGCGLEHQLEAARQALDPKLNRNPGFLRDEALLVIVFITDEDDCSAKRTELFDPSKESTYGPMNFRCFEYGITCDVNGRSTPGPRVNCRPTLDSNNNSAYLYAPEDYVTFFKSLKPKNPDRVIVATIAGPTAPVNVAITDGQSALSASCTGAMGEAAPAIRLKAVTDKFVENGQFNNICEGNFGKAFEALADKIRNSLGGQCIGGPPISDENNIVCKQGEELGTNSKGQLVICEKSCLELASCNVEEHVGGEDGNIQTVEKCPAELFYNDEDKPSCGSHCPCWRLRVPTGTDKCLSAPYGVQILHSSEPAKNTTAHVCCQSSAYKYQSALYADTPQCGK